MSEVPLWCGTRLLVLCETAPLVRVKRVMVGRLLLLCFFSLKPLEKWLTTNCAPFALDMLPGSLTDILRPSYGGQTLSLDPAHDCARVTD